MLITVPRSLRSTNSMTRLQVLEQSAPDYDCRTTVPFHFMAIGIGATKPSGLDWVLLGFAECRIRMVPSSARCAAHACERALATGCLATFLCQPMAASCPKPDLIRLTCSRTRPKRIESPEFYDKKLHFTNVASGNQRSIL